ncbi:hypothetical protein BDU57DRAFT_456246 [Ampelomyces quisqualis]|uniref:RBR-type E3 ubiquitin transferase n=1 Tax=Ampelomyces quisqualis TaxID=50730 RepID=A0A6A5QEN3_AMPQU|nr:hypothetical protein BDU57DRAFT_456246 [Ampelomyces quisqualis]
MTNTKSQSTKSRSSKPGSHHSKTHPNKECIICTDTRSSHHFPDVPPTAQCTHDSNVCRRCLRAWIKTSLSTKIWTELSCPICAAQLQHADVRALAAKEVFRRRYDKLTTKAHHESTPDWRWCLARGCSAGQVHTAHTLRFRCKSCRKTHCVACGVAWHRGETCAQHQDRYKAQDAASRRVVAQTTKKCPGCACCIEKSFGCDHMLCSRCRLEFCWQCLTPYGKKGGVTRVGHRRGCEHNEAGWDGN